MARRVIALVDESILLSGNGCSLLACVVLPLDRKAAVRRELRRLSPRRRRVHWKDEEQRERMALLGLLSAEAADLFAYVRRPVVRREHEAARSVLLAALLEDVGQTDSLDLPLESRQTVNDVADRKVVAAAQLAGRISSELSYGHSGPREEPLLALADVLAGGVMAHVRGDNHYVAALPADRLRVRAL